MYLDAHKEGMTSVTWELPGHTSISWAAFSNFAACGAGVVPPRVTLSRLPV